MLTAKQQRFCDEYLIDSNGKQAAIRAGYSEATAEQQASRLLSNAKVSEYIKNKQCKREIKTGITQERVLAEFGRIGFSDIRQYYNEDGSFKEISELSDDAAAAIAAVEVEEIRDKNGKVTGYTKKIKLWGKPGALESICKLQGYNAPERHKIELDGLNINIV